MPRERDPIEIGEASRFIRELARRKIGELPELALRTLGTTLLRGLAIAAGLRQTIALTKMRHKLQRLITGHRVFPVAPFFVLDRPKGSQGIGPRPPPVVDCRVRSGY